MFVRSDGDKRVHTNLVLWLLNSFKKKITTKLYGKWIIRKGQTHGINLLNSEFGSWEGLCNKEYVNKNRGQRRKKNGIKGKPCTQPISSRS